MNHLKKAYSIYGQTGGMLLVLILLTASVFYVLIGPSVNEQHPNADITVAQITQGSVGAQIQEGGKVKIAIIGEGYSKSDFDAKVQQFIGSLGNVAPYGDAASFFEFIPVDNINTSGCVQSIETCIKSSAIRTVVQIAMDATGAVGVVVLTNGGGDTSYSIVGLPGPSIINGSHIASPGLAIHEFLGHMVGKLNDRYNNESIGGSGSLGLNLSNCSRSASGESWWKTADPNSTTTISCSSPDTYAPYINDCGAGKGNSNTVMSTGNCSRVNVFDPIEQYWISHNVIPYLPKNGTTTNPPGSDPPTSCKCIEGWVRIDGEDKYPFTGDCGQKYTDPDGAEWACTDSQVDRGWQKLQPGMCMNGHIMDNTSGKILSWFYLGSDNQGVCGTDKKEYRCQSGNWNATGNSCGPTSTTPTGSPPGTTPPPSTKTCDQLYQARGFASYQAACQSINQTACSAGSATGSCQCTPNCSGGNPPPSQYSLNSTVDKTSVKPGETVVMCYTITPGVAFTAHLWESKTGGAPFEVQSWQASGAANECADLVIDSSAFSGSREFIIKAIINNSEVATTSKTVQITAPGNTTITTTPGVTGQIITPGVTGNITITTTPGVTTTPVPGNGNVSVLANLIGVGNTSGENKNPQPQNRQIQIKLFNPTNQQEVNSFTSDLNYESNSGLFKGNISILAGNYIIKTRLSNSLWRDSGIITASDGGTASFATINFASGDLNQDNIMDLRDYTIFLSCYGSRSCSQKQNADLNMDGKVNQFDLNIFYSGLANRSGD